MSTLPYAECGSHGEEGLDHRAEKEPETSFGPDAVADATEKGTEDEGEDGGEGLLVGEVEGAIPLTDGAVEQAS